MRTGIATAYYAFTDTGLTISLHGDAHALVARVEQGTGVSVAAVSPLIGRHRLARAGVAHTDVAIVVQVRAVLGRPDAGTSVARVVLRANTVVVARGTVIVVELAGAVHAGVGRAGIAVVTVVIAETASGRQVGHRLFDPVDLRTHVIDPLHDDRIDRALFSSFPL